MTDKKKVKLYVTAVKLGYENEFKIEVNSFDKSTFDNHGGIAIPLSVVEVEVEIPTISGEQLQAEEVKQLQAAIQKEIATALGIKTGLITMISSSIGYSLPHDSQASMSMKSSIIYLL